MPARNAGLSSHHPGKLNNSKWPQSKFSRAMTTKSLRPAFLAGIKPCDVIMHKVYCPGCKTAADFKHEIGN
jgi:hypothetical protein